MSHTFTAPQGTTFHYNSDLSGMVLAFVVQSPQWVEIPGVDLVAFHEHVTKGEQCNTSLVGVANFSDYAPDRERIEFIRRAYLARLISHPDSTLAYVNTSRGTLSGTEALRHLAEQDWEAVKDLEAEPDGC